MFSRLTFLLSLLKALSTSTNSRHSLLSSSKLFLTSCIAASMPDSSPAHVCSVPTACVMSSFGSPVIVLPMIRHRHSPTPTGLMPLSFFFSGTSLHARRVDMESCGMVSVARCLARVAFHQLAFLSGCRMILNKSFLSRYPCQSVLVFQAPMSF